MCHFCKASKVASMARGLTLLQGKLAILALHDMTWSSLLYERADSSCSRLVHL